MEDLFWESPYPTFTFYDYTTLADSYSKGESSTPVVTEMTRLFSPSNISKSRDDTQMLLRSQTLNFLPLHSDDLFFNSGLLGTKSVSLLSVLTDTQDFDDAYASSKTQTFVPGNIST